MIHWEDELELWTGRNPANTPMGEAVRLAVTDAQWLAHVSEPEHRDAARVEAQQALAQVNAQLITDLSDDPRWRRGAVAARAAYRGLIVRFDALDRVAASAAARAAKEKAMADPAYWAALDATTHPANQPGHTHAPPKARPNPAAQLAAMGISPDTDWRTLTGVARMLAHNVAQARGVVLPDDGSVVPPSPPAPPAKEWEPGPATGKTNDETKGHPLRLVGAILVPIAKATGRATNGLDPEPGMWRHLSATLDSQGADHPAYDLLAALIDWAEDACAEALSSDPGKG